MKLLEIRGIPKLQLGQKVKCYGYMKKQKIKPVIYDEKDEFAKHCPDDCIVWDDPFHQRLYKFKNIEFEGIVIGKKQLPLSMYFDIGFHHDGSERPEISKTNYIEVYKIAYALNHTRLVPVKKVKVLN
ncbi:hypothetical protein KHQ81_12990 [Mycoplasmatota bacterium]|nr:hypothetical protein KHQ81_12990 [Mycoplasmatota bacterium]